MGSPPSRRAFSFDTALTSPAPAFKPGSDYTVSLRFSITSIITIVTAVIPPSTM